MSSPTTDSPIKNVAQAAEFLGTGKDIVYELAARGEIPHCHVGRHLRFHQADLEEYVRNSHHHQSLLPENLRALRERISGASRNPGRREVKAGNVRD